MKSKAPFTKLIPFIIFSNLSIVYCQSSAKKEILNYFDKNVGTIILDSNNGKAHIDPYNLQQNQHNFYLDKNFVVGTIFYNKQIYNNVLIRYDIFKDELVKSFDQSNSFGLTLIDDKLEYFIINNQTFVNIDHKFKKSDEVTGYYEEKYVGKKMSLYIKHFKTAKEVIIRSTLFTDFKESRNHQLFYNSEFKTVNTQKEIIALFPQFKKEIKAYYKNKNNLFLIENNPDQFKADLIKHIDTTL